MSSHKSILLLKIIIELLVSSCGRQKALLFTPSRNPFPLFKGKGDLYGDVSIGLVKADATFGFAISNAFAMHGAIGGDINNQSDDVPEIFLLQPSKLHITNTTEDLMILESDIF